ncbi:hypothetical protein [Campylobacter hyointestinalis]|uniref:hypothetical protein n=1 Tax=Campylobacter hyointestinalis TaxID=198 RepID=UPI000CE39E34|nr:hypothetical protein [Campylobacter hyointestinalis]PPB52952.1 hypothetical protein CDQ69_05975 [Campylobacter hyointestinalis subsp. hyointestinalis]PPB54277.1 hypothetical protein CDQ67_07655 [Campylobacter hyointestinalis subsp. hyointestinalis]
MNIKELLLLNNQDELMDYIINFIRKSNKYHSVTDVNGGVLALPKGANKYPLICIHLDTINTHKKAELKTDDLIIDDDDIISLNTKARAVCLGGDDRAGVYIALQLIKAKKPFAFGFFKDEEIGCIGSSSLSSYINSLDNITAFIGLDRRGADEVATYGHDNKELINIFESKGYIEAVGSVTDASKLSALSNKGLACVNLSVGYYNEHTKKEILNTTAMNHTLKVLKNLDISLFNKPFKAEFNKPLFRGISYGLMGDMWESEHMLENEIREAEEGGDYSVMLENAYIDGYNYALEIGYSEAIKEYRDMSCKGDDEYMAYFNGFGDALDDMENFKA